MLRSVDAARTWVRAVQAVPGEAAHEKETIAAQHMRPAEDATAGARDAAQLQAELDNQWVSLLQPKQVRHSCQTCGSGSRAGHPTPSVRLRSAQRLLMLAAPTVPADPPDNVEGMRQGQGHLPAVSPALPAI